MALRRTAGTPDEPMSFTTQLDSALPAVRFTAVLTASWTAAAPWQRDDRRLPALVRHAVRQAVGAVAGKQDPVDPHAAADAVLCQVSGQVKAADGVLVSLLDAEFSLDETSRASLADYDATYRSDRQRQDAVRRQVEGLRDLLADPALGPTWVLRHRPELAGQATDLLAAISATGTASTAAPPADPLVELLLDFVAPVGNHAQRLLILRALPPILRALGRHDLADRAEPLGEPDTS